MKMKKKFIIVNDPDNMGEDTQQKLFAIGYRWPGRNRMSLFRPSNGGEPYCIVLYPDEMKIRWMSVATSNGCSYEYEQVSLNDILPTIVPDELFKM